MRPAIINILKALAAILLFCSRIQCVAGQVDSAAIKTINMESVRNSVFDEKVILTTDREIYLCGENIYFTAFTCESNWFLPVSFSSILYIELYNQDYQVISKGKFNINKGKSSGKLTIPRTLSTNYYYLRAYTNYMKNFGERQFYLQKVRVINPFFGYSPDTTFVKGEGVKKTDIFSNTVSLEKFNIALVTQRKKYGNREEVKVNIHSTDNEGNPVLSDLSLFVCLSTVENDTAAQAVSDKTLFNMIPPATPIPVRKIGSEAVLKYLPEIKGDIITGKLIYKDKQPAGGIEVLQSFVGKSGHIESCISGKDGSFTFLTVNDGNKGDLILKVVKSDKEITCIPDNEFYDSFTPHKKEAIRLTKDEIALIEKEFINLQVDDAFSSGIVKDSIESGAGISSFYGNVYKEYKFSNYAKLPNMKEFIFEIIEGVVSGKENKQEVLKILDESAFREIGPNPLIIIDGIPVNEASVVTELDPEKVQDVRVVRDKYFYKRQIFDGILDIITYKGDASSFKLPENTFRYDFIHSEKAEPATNYQFVNNQEGRIPVYRNILFLNPSITTDTKGEAEITFYTPDNAGTFVIRCFGLTPEGRAGEGTAVITVGDNQTE